MEKNTNQEKPKSGCLIALILILIFFIWWILSPNEKEELQKKEEIQQSELDKTKKKSEENINNIDYSNIKYTFPNSQYTFDVKITNIKSKLKKNEFESKDDEYSVAKKVDGYILSISLEFSNPYEKEMMAPIPNYYAITSLDKQYFSGSTTNSRSCGCNIDNSTEIKDSKGRDLWSIAEGKCGIGNEYCIKFKPKETKSIIITFTDPIIITQKKIVFIAFSGTYKEVGSTRDRDIGLVLNVETGKVEGMKYL